MYKECPKHGVTAFSGSIRSRCKKCNVEAVQRKRKKLKEAAIAYMGGKCSVCGYNNCRGALEFHHLNSNEKDFGISERGWTLSWDKTLIELQKCVLMCANCHREAHWLREP